MDLEEYLKQLSDDLDKELNSLIPLEIDQNVASQHDFSDTFHFCPYCGEELKGEMTYCPYCGEKLKKEIAEPKKIKPLCCLKHFDDFEEATKSKIGTFEKIYNRAFFEETGRPLIEHYGFDTMDYAPLVNPLTSALEIELNASIMHLLRSIYGNDFVFKGKKNVELKYKNNSLRDIQVCMEEDILYENAIYKAGMTNIEDCAKDLNRIITIRNNASHKKEISKETFFSFYDNLFAFFERYMDGLLAIKRPVENNFEAPKCHDRNCKHEGIIFTDTLLLSKKIFGVDSQANYFVNLFLGENGYINKMLTAGIKYHFLDVAQYPDFKRTGQWQDYYYLLDKYYNSLSHDHNLPESVGLFIVGGEDVIPMPRVLSSFGIYDIQEVAPYINMNLSSREYDYAEDVFESDYLYSFPGSNLSFMRGNCWVDPADMFDLAPKLWVSRYPLERDSVESDVEPVSQYLDKVIENLVETPCSPLGQQIPITCDSLKKSSEVILKKLPLPKINDIDGVIYHKRFVSPKVNLEDGWNDVNKLFQDKITKADMLTFLLHGSGNKQNSGYMGQSMRNLQQFTLAFHLPLVKNCNARFLAGLCCWGARYTGFESCNSMLLTAMKNKALLFMGSCRSARGYFDTPGGAKVEITLGEILLKKYLDNLMQGFEAGKALALAKYSYMHNPDQMQSDVLATILEFNLYGDPFITVHPSKQNDYLTNESYSLNQKNMNREYIKIYDLDEAKGDTSLLEQIRSLVDDNLKEIRTKVSNELYANYHIGYENLSKVYSFKDENGDSGYRLDYKYKSLEMEQTLMVDTDDKGNILHILGTI